MLFRSVFISSKVHIDKCSWSLGKIFVRLEFLILQRKLHRNVSPTDIGADSDTMGQ